MERTAVVVEALRCAIEKNRDLALEVQALEVVHAQRRCMHGLADEYRRRLDLRLRCIETRLGQELVLEPQRDAAPVAIDGEARALALARGLEQRDALEERAVVAGRLQADGGEAFGEVGRCPVRKSQRLNYSHQCA